MHIRVASKSSVPFVELTWSSVYRFVWAGYTKMMFSIDAGGGFDSIGSTVLRDEARALPQRENL